MYQFPELLRKIRIESGLTQSEFAKVLGISTVLISMIETKQKAVSKGFIIKLANKLGVQPSSIMPFVFMEESPDLRAMSGLEKSLMDLGEKMQNYLIKKKAKRLKMYV